MNQSIIKLTILFVPLDLRIDQNHFVFNNHDYNDGSFNIQMLYELMKWLKYCTRIKYTTIPTTIWMFHAASKTKHDYKEINEIDHRKLCFHAYTLRIPWGLYFNECESSLTDYLYSVCMAMIAWMLFFGDILVFLFQVMCYLLVLEPYEICNVTVHAYIYVWKINKFYHGLLQYIIISTY